MSLTAQAPLPVLLDALARAGWADLDGRAAQGVRSVLRGLCSLLPHGSATGLVTAHQIADAAGLKIRQTRSNLHVLEDAGLITWTRGGIKDGHPTPGAIKVNKRALLGLVRAARRAMPERLATRAAETAKRLRETLNARTIRNAARARRWRDHGTTRDHRANPAPHAAFNAPLSPSREVTGAATRHALAPTGTGQTKPGTLIGRKRPKAAPGTSRFAAVQAQWAANGR